MANLSKERREILALIDAILAMSEKYPTDNSYNVNVGISLNSFDFLLDIITKKVSFEELVEWLVNYITTALPGIELGVKGVILSNLKSLIDCNNDPRIPNWIREEGLKFNIFDLDYKNILSVSPLSPEGKYFYFGTSTYYVIDGDEEENKKYYDRSVACRACIEQGIPMSHIKKISECDNVYKLARANDFNAFLWFIVHKAYFPNVVPFNAANFSGGNIYSVLEGSGNKYIPGNCVSNNGVISLCIEGENEDSNDTYEYDNNEYLTNDYHNEAVASRFLNRNYRYKFVPCSTGNTSANWYVNSGTFFNFLIPEEERVYRDFNKDYPICNLEFKEREVSSGLYNVLTFKILPKPKVHLPSVLKEPLWRVKPILFDKNGEPDSKGKYSSNGYTYDVESGSYSATDKNNLYECYPKLTVYEFNYDFVMGMQLFDPTVVASQLMEIVMNLRCASVNINKSETAYQMRVSEIVKNIIESTAYEVSDCFYTFDNAKYDKMLRDAELKRSRLYVNNDDNKSVNEHDGNDVFNILNEFDSNATLNENKEVIKRAITTATAKITDEVLPEDAYSIKFNIIKDLITVLTNVLVETLLSPKIVLLIEVNRALMGMEDKNKYNIEDFLKSIEGLITSIVRELVDLILQELLNWCLKILGELLEVLSDELVKESLEYYSRLIKLLFKACWFKASHRAPLETKLDHVDYADIDEIDKPQESNC